MSIFSKKILKNSKKGYTLTYTMIAMVVSLALIFSTISISTYYNNNLARKNGTRGALLSAQSGIEVTEDYLNLCYKELHGNAYSAEELYSDVYDILNDLIITGEQKDSSDYCGLILQGYSNYEYAGPDATGNVAASLTPDAKASGFLIISVYEAISSNIQRIRKAPPMMPRELCLPGEAA